MNQTATLTAQDWRARASALAINGQAFIDGRYVEAASGETFDDVTPIDGRVIARVASTDKADVERAVAAARRAFDSGVWSRRPPRERKRVLQRFAELVLAHRDELALLETLDMGKPISDSLAVDIPATARLSPGTPKPSTRCTMKWHRLRTTSLPSSRASRSASLRRSCRGISR